MATKSAIFINAGLGNALLLLPLIKALKADGHQLTAVVTSPWPCEELFRDANIFEDLVVLRKNRDRLSWSMRNVRKYQFAYLDFFAATRKNVVLAKAVASSVRTNHWPERSMPEFAQLNVLVHSPEAGIHEGLQNLRLHQPQAQPEQLQLSDFAYPGQPPALAMLSGIVQEALAPTSNRPFVAVQVSAGNNQTPYKNWPPEHWVQCIEALAHAHPSMHFVLLGDGNETAIGDYIASKAPDKVINLVGQTTIREVMAVLNACALYLGVDSGLMHLAVSFGKPTLTIWGASDPLLYGYQQLHPGRHRIVQQPLFCQPCNSWIAPNTQRVNDPLRCPDFKCIRTLPPLLVQETFHQMVHELALR